MQCVFKSDFPSLQSFWSYLYGRFFSQMNSESLTMAYRLETNVLRFAAIYTPSLNKPQVCMCGCFSFLTAGCFWCRPARQGDMRRYEPSLRRCLTPSTTARSGRTGLVSLSPTLSLFRCVCVCARVCLARLCVCLLQLCHSPRTPTSTQRSDSTTARSGWTPSRSPSTTSSAPSSPQSISPSFTTLPLI